MKELTKHYLKLNLVILLAMTLTFNNCVKENDIFNTDQNAVEPEVDKGNQSHLRAKDMPTILDFVNAETNNTRQVLINGKSIKKARQDYRNSGMDARTETGFGYIDTSNALVVKDENIATYTFNVVTKDMATFINYIVVEDRTTSSVYGVFIRYTPTTEWIDNKMPLTAFLGTIEYFDENEELQTTLTLSDGYIIDYGNLEIDCPEIVFDQNEDPEPDDDGSTSGGGGYPDNNGDVDDSGVDDTDYDYNPWENWWIDWVASGSSGGGTGDNEEFDDGEDGASDNDSNHQCDIEPGEECQDPDHPYPWNNRAGQINLKTSPTATNPCFHTGVVAFLMGQLGFTAEQVDWLNDIAQADVYVEVIDYLNTQNYAPEAVEFVFAAIEAGINSTLVSFFPLVKYPEESNYANDYPNITNYLKEELPKLADDELIIQALEQYGSFSEAQIIDALKWGSESSTIIEIHETMPFDAWGAHGIVFGLDSDTIVINAELENVLSQGSTISQDALNFFLAIVILHEITHMGDYLYNGDMYNGEEGEDFELYVTGITQIDNPLLVYQGYLLKKRD